MNATVRRADPARRVLVVEDDDTTCELISDILEAEDFIVQYVQSDRNAYAALASGAGYAALVVDIDLGAGTTGYDVARFARQIRPGLPVIYVTGLSTRATFSAFGVPGSIFLSKPFMAEELAAHVRQLVAEQSS
jgi:DNA-binding response OmpR family regulator